MLQKEVDGIIAKRFRIICYLLLAWFLLIPRMASAADEVINKIAVSITTTDNVPAPPERIAKRMAASVSTVGEHVLIGHAVSDIAENKASYERVVREVFDRILVGYSVQDVDITPGPVTHITLEIIPWGDVVRDVALEVDYGGVSPEIKTLIKNDLGNMEEKVKNVLIGLPIDAVDWAGGVSKAVIRDILSSQLPEFNSNFDIVSGSQTTVKLSLAPFGPTVQDVHISLRSHTIPNLLLIQARPAMDVAAKSLNGLPVAFIERHRDYFTAKLTAIAAEHPVARQYGLTLTPYIYAGADTEIAVEAETTKYKIKLEGYLDVGRSAHDNTSAKLHVGKFVGKQDEGFMEINFAPSSVTWEFLPGWSHLISNHTAIGAKYSLSAKQDILFLNKDFGRNWSLRWERTPASGYNEFGLRYKIQDFLSAEYVFTNNDRWLRLVANL